MSALATPAAILAAAAVLTWLRPRWALPAAIVALPLRLPVAGIADLPTLVVLGAAIGAAPAIARAVSRQPVATLALLVLPLWVLASSLWARQPIFAMREAAKWLAVSIAALLALADERDDARPLVAAACLALIPSALWAVAERLRAIPPLGDPHELGLRLIWVGDLVRGRALYYHPNRLAEFVEQVGLLLAACAVCGPWRAASALGALAALAGTWASGSTAGMAVMGGGGALTVAALVAWRALAGESDLAGDAAQGARARRIARAAVIVGGAAAVAAAVAVVAYQVHGGLGSRQLVYREAWEVIARAPVLGLGGGNWGFEMASEPMRRFWFSGHTHSLVLQLWVELGAVGVLLGGAMFVVPMALALRAVARGPAAGCGIAAGAAAGLAGLLAHDLVHYFLREPADGLMTGVLLGLAAAAARRLDAGA